MWRPELAIASGGLAVYHQLWCWSPASALNVLIPTGYQQDANRIPTGYQQDATRQRREADDCCNNPYLMGRLKDSLSEARTAIFAESKILQPEKDENVCLNFKSPQTAIIAIIFPSQYYELRICTSMTLLKFFGHHSDF